MQRVIRRVGLPFVIVAALTLLAVSASSLFLAVGYHNQLNELKATIFQRCQQRTVTDTAVRDSAAADLTEQRALLALFHGVPRSQPLRRILSAKIAKDRAVIARSVIGDCSVFKQ